MGRISSGVGLVSGLNYQQLADSLIAVDKVPVDQLTKQVNTLKQRQVAFTSISASLLSMSFSVSQFGQSRVLQARQASTSDDSLLRATADSTAVPGSYNFRPVRQAQAQRFTSAGFADFNTAPVGAGTITIKQGGFVTSDTSLDLLNGGAGVVRGKIRLTDRSGVSAVVDLSAARTVGDVLKAINDNGVASITASTVGDALVLTDHTGQTTANLAVQEIGAGTTAAGLGLLGSVASATKTGSDVLRLSGDAKLADLNDGLGVRRHGTQDDLRITLKSGATIDVNLGSAKTIQDVLTAINGDSQNVGTLTATLAGDGDKIVLTDTTGGGGTLNVAALNGSQAARDLGIVGNEQAGGVLTGGRLLAGLNSVLLKNLRGGQGVATPGQVQLTDRSGATATIDLTNAHSLGDVVAAINAAGLGLTAAVNGQGHGLTITDTTGASASNLIVADVGGGTTAADLQIAGSVGLPAIRSGDLHQTFVNENTLLSRLNGGAGIGSGLVKITDKAGKSAVLNVAGTSFKTVGDVLSAVNAAAVDVTATINATGDGILLTDTSGGTGSLAVEDQNGGKVAANLNIKKTSATAIDGALKYEIELDADDTLTDVVVKLSTAGAPLTASVFNTGGPAGFRLLLGAKKSGEVGRLLVDSGTTGLNFTQSQEAQDAVLQLSGTGATPVLFASGTNAFEGIVTGLSLEVRGTSTTNVNVTVGENGDALVEALSSFVDGFNKVADVLRKQTAYDTTTNTKSTLQGDRTANQLQEMLFDLIGRQYGPSGNAIRNFAQLGIRAKGGQLSFDEAVLRDQMAKNPDAVQSFFDAADVGAAAVVKKAVNNFGDARTGVLFRRIESLDSQTTGMQTRIDVMSKSLENRRTRLMNQFLTLEKTLAQLQSQQNSLGSLASALTSSNSSASKSSG